MKPYLNIVCTMLLVVATSVGFAQIQQSKYTDFKIEKEKPVDVISVIYAEDGLTVYAHQEPKRIRIESEDYIKYIELLDQRKILKYWQLIEPSKNVILPGKYWKTNGYWLRILSSNGEHVVNLSIE